MSKHSAQFKLKVVNDYLQGGVRQHYSIGATIKPYLSLLKE